MKGFRRFPHEGVLRDLSTIKDHFSDDARYSFGSSGEGELTIKGPIYTAYIRKYKRLDGWRVAVCSGSKEVKVVKPESTPEVLEFLSKNLR